MHTSRTPFGIGVVRSCVLTSISSLINASNLLLKIQTRLVVKSLRSANYRPSMWCFNLLLKSVKWRTNPHDSTLTAAEPLICVCYRELELSSVFETIEGEGLSLYHSHLIGKATPHPFRHPHLHPKPPPLPVPQLPALLPPQSCSSPLSLYSVPATFDTTEHTVTAVFLQF